MYYEPKYVAASIARNETRTNDLRRHQFRVATGFETHQIELPRIVIDRAKVDEAVVKTRHVEPNESVSRD